MDSKQTVRTRFAPSPTGALHAGTVRTALFSWLLARQGHGQFLLRIEDTDQKREVAHALDNIKGTLQWLGLTWDEGPDIGGPAGSYFQSERLNIYKEWAQKLVDSGHAYAAIQTPDELNVLRQQAQEQKRPFLFREHRPSNAPEWDGSQPLRFKSNPKSYNWSDEVMGEHSMGPEMIDDFIIIKSDGFPTYNFAHVIDDYLMGITLVLRSQEFLSSIPNYLNLYEALGFQLPAMAIVPVVLRPDGRKKLSKRDGAKELLWYKQQGFLPQAMLNFMATLGWNDGTEQEIFSIDELITKFDLKRVQKGGAKFDEQRLLWMNGSHIRTLSLGELYIMAEEFWPAEAKNQDEQFKKQVLGLVQERLKYLAELPELTQFFFVDQPVDPSLITNNKQLQKLAPKELKALLEASRAVIADSDFSVEDLTTRLNQLLKTTGQKPAVLFSLIRIATTQTPASPALTESLSILGKETSLRRIDAQLEVM